MDKIEKTEAENIIERYLELANTSYFNLVIKHPIYKTEEKIKRINELKEQASNTEIPWEEVYNSVEPDSYEKRQIKLIVCRDDTKEYEECWSIRYQTNLFIETGNPIYTVFGYGWFLIDKYTSSAFITSSSRREEFWARDYGNWKNNKPRELEMDRTWEPLNLNEMELRFLVYGPVEKYGKK